MRLEVLLEEIREIEAVGRPASGTAVDFTACADDHRSSGAGSLFAALRGARHDGHQWAAEALERGASGVLLDNPVLARDLARRFPSQAVLLTQDTRKALGPVAAAIYGHPSRRLRAAAVTGTNGKTTTAFLLESVFRTADLPTALIGTVEVRWPGHVEEAAQTTPGAVTLQSWLARAVKAGARSLAIEISSHALDQRRTDGLELDCAVFTNLTRDHLDYHRTLEHYFESKARLFTALLPASSKERKVAVINLDDPLGAELVRRVPAGIRTLTFSREASAGADVYPETATISAGGISSVIRSPQGAITLRSRLTGAFNLSNLLGAFAAGAGMGFPLETVARGLELALPPPGRLERVDGPGGFELFVDYAHTPDAVENVLSTLRPLTAGKLITVFGCGGDRDATKRPKMAAAAARFSDAVILTSDNPRTESPARILDDCEAGFREASFPVLGSGRGYLRIPERRDAIREAIRMARPGDIVAICGKGHETYQIVGTEKFPFDDRLEAGEAMKLKQEGRL